MPLRFFFVPVALILALWPAPASAQSAPSAVGANSDRIVTAIRLTSPIVLDGRLNDEVYTLNQPAGGFIQQEPREGEPASEATEVWIMFDERNLYVAARCSDSAPEREIATELRRDSSNISQGNEAFGIIFDTFHDRRNGLQFQVNPLGAQRDSAIVDAVATETWNTIWDVRTDRTDEGFTLEMAIPFKSLRYARAGEQTWGIQIRRNVKWKNEVDHLTPMPAVLGANGLSHLELAATLVGLETPSQSMNLELKPYAVSSLTTDLAAASPFRNSGKGDVGLDFKYGLTRGLIFDATVNTDFAQVEEDQQQVNLTRFSLFFPEKRDFFLESQGNFSFGGVSSTGNPGDLPVLFFSRQIGLSRGQAVPVIAGGRLTGRTGRYQVGAVNIQTGDDRSAGAEATNFTAVRVKRDILRRSNVGIIATRRSLATDGTGDNLAFGVDTALLLTTTVTANAYYARTDSAGATKGQASYRGRFDYLADRYGLSVEHMVIEPDFSPQVGFVRRTDLSRSFLEARFSPRPRNSRIVRKYSYTASFDYITDAAFDVIQEKEAHATFNVDYQRGDSLNIDYQRNHELLPSRFTINPGTFVPAGRYDYQNVRAQYTIGAQKKVSGRLFGAYGSLYEGRKTEVGYTGRAAIVPQFALEPTISLNWVRLPFGDFSAPVIGTRIIATPNPRLALTSFLQYNGGTRALSSSVRLRWEYRGGSELFLVYSDGRNTSSSGFPDMVNRTLAVKATRLLRF
jgi:hypothetical protein